MRSASGTNSGSTCVVTFLTNARIACLAAVSFQDGSGSVNVAVVVGVAASSVVRVVHATSAVIAASTSHVITGFIDLLRGWCAIETSVDGRLFPLPRQIASGRPGARVRATPAFRFRTQYAMIATPRYPDPGVPLNSQSLEYYS